MNILKKKFHSQFGIGKQVGAFSFYVLLFCIFLFLFPSTIFANSLPVESVYNDITKDYQYYDELQELTDKGLFSADMRGRFNPKKLLKRDEFVGIISEISCKKCIKPDVGYDYLSKYYDKNPFFDVEKTSKYFYCIAGAKDKEIIKGYDKGTVCENGTSKSGKAPFCPENTIILEEALAIILRESGILSNMQANTIRREIQSGVKYKDLSKDVKSKLPSGDVYSFYPDFYKALDYSIFEYDASGKRKVYHLLEKKGDYLNPKKAISKEEFLKMAYVALKANLCIENRDYYIGLKMKIYDTSCSPSKVKNCKLSDLGGRDKVYDFMGEVGIPEYDSISNPDAYIWRFYDFSNGNEVIKTGKYIDNYNFLKDGKYRVYLTVKTDAGLTGEVYNDINIGNGVIQNIGKNNNLKVSIDANPISGKQGVVVDFRGIISSGTNIVSYNWDYGDGKKGYGIRNSHIYRKPGVYKVRLTVTDGEGKTSGATVLIRVFDEDKDTDGDGVVDREDYEIETPGDKIDYICTKEDIRLARYTCISTDLGVYKPEKENEINKGKLGLKIKIYDKTCNYSNIGNCRLSDLDGREKVYDFYGDVALSKNDSVKDSSFTWTFTNKDTGNSIIKYGRYINNYDFLNDGNYRVYLEVTTNLGAKKQVYNDISIKNTAPKDFDNLKVSINANPIKTFPGQEITFEAVITNGGGKPDITWDFGDGASGKGKNVTHSYNTPGVYEVKVTVTTKDGRKKTATVIIFIEKEKDTDGDGVVDSKDKCVTIPGPVSNFGCPIPDDTDTDKDGTLDKDDACPTTPGPKENKGCPIYEKECKQDSDCAHLSYCDRGYCKPRVIKKTCEYNGTNLFLGNVVCDTCPCDTSYKFRANLRNCDIIFPAITSPDEKTIFSKGDYYQILRQKK